jgi:hypothetical protein
VFATGEVGGRAKLLGAALLIQMLGTNAGTWSAATSARDFMTAIEQRSQRDPVRARLRGRLRRLHRAGGRLPLQRGQLACSGASG